MVCVFKRQHQLLLYPDAFGKPNEPHDDDDDDDIRSDHTAHAGACEQHIAEHNTGSNVGTAYEAYVDPD